MADIKKKTQVTSPTEDEVAGMVPADVRTQRSYTAERAHKLAVKVKDIPSSAKKVAKKTMDDVAMTPFLRKISFFSSGGSFLDGYVLSLIGVALTQIVPMFNLTAAESAAIGASVMVGIFFGTIFGGYLTDAIGRKKMFTIDIIAIAVFSILSVFRGLFAAKPAVIDAAVVRLDRAQMRTVGAVGFAHLFGKRPAALATIPDCLLSDEGLNMVVHLERSVEIHVDTVVQRSGVVKAVVERGGHFLVDRQRHAENRQHLQIGVFRIVLVDVFEVDLAIPCAAAAQRADLKVFEGVVSHERTESLSYDFG